jgi:hypothetical protein
MLTLLRTPVLHGTMTVAEAIGILAIGPALAAFGAIILAVLP